MSSIIRLDFPSTQAYAQSGVPSSLGPFDIITPDRIYTLVPLPLNNKEIEKKSYRSSHPPQDIWNDETPEQTKLRNSSSNSQVSYYNPPQTSFSSFTCCMPIHENNNNTNQPHHSQVDVMNITLSVRDFKQCIVDSRSISNSIEAGGTVAKLLLKRDVNDGGIPWEFECPLTLEIMQDPVVASDGNTYEREAIEEWFERSGLTSVSGNKMTSQKIVPNYRLKEEISAYIKAKHILKESAYSKQENKLSSPKNKNQQRNSPISPTAKSPRSSKANWW